MFLYVSVMFCSLKCQEEAQKMYHKYECFINILTETHDAIHGMRSLFYALYLFDDSIDALKTFILARGSIRKTIFDYDLRNLSSIEIGRISLHCLDSLDAPEYHVNMDVANVIFETHPLLCDMWEREQDFITTFIRRHSSINQNYAHGLFKWPGNTTELAKVDPQMPVGNLRRKVGFGSYLFSTLFSHSCVPNVHRHYNFQNKLHLIVCKDILAGEQISVSFR